MLRHIDCDALFIEENMDWTIETLGYGSKYDFSPKMALELLEEMIKMDSAFPQVLARI